MRCLAGSLLWQDIWGDQFNCFWKNVWMKKTLDISSGKKCACLRFPKESDRLFSTNYQGTGPWTGPVHCSRYVLRAHNCSNFIQSWSWSQEKKGMPFPKAIAKFKVITFPKRIRPLIKSLLKDNFPQISKALGHERVQFTFIGLPSGFTIAANFSRADLGNKRGKVSLFQKQLPSSKSKPFPKESDRWLHPY